MKSCSRCGTLLDDKAAFCVSCGANSFAPGTPVSPAAPYAPSGVAVVDTPAIAVLRKLAMSPILLGAAILFSVSLLFNLITILNIEETVTGFLMLTGEVSRRDISVIGEIVGSIGVVVGILALTPSILATIGMWLTIASANKKGERITTAGLTLVQVMPIVSIVLLSLVTAFYVVIFAVALNQTGMYMTDDAVMGVVVSLVLFSAIMAFAIFCQAKTLTTISTIKRTILTGQPAGKVSAFVGVMSIISGGFSILLLLFAPISLASLPVLAPAAASILFGIFLFVYNENMRPLLYPTYSAPVYPKPYAPAVGSAPAPGYTAPSQTQASQNAAHGRNQNTPPRQ